MGQGVRVGEIRGPQARRLLAEAEKEIARLRRRAEDDDRLLEVRDQERKEAIEALYFARERIEVLEKDAAAAPFLAEMVTERDEVIASLTGPDDPALDIDQPQPKAEEVPAPAA